MTFSMVVGYKHAVQGEFLTGFPVAMDSHHIGLFYLLTGLVMKVNDINFAGNLFVQAFFLVIGYNWGKIARRALFNQEKNLMAHPVEYFAFGPDVTLGASVF